MSDKPEKKSLEEIGHAVHELRQEVEKKTADPEKIERINAFLDGAEEKILQPIARAQQEIKNREAEVADLKTQLEAEGKSSGEVRARVDALELELARRGGGGAEEKGYKEKPEYKALNEYLKHGERLPVEHKELLRTDSAIDGGVLVTTEMDNVITKKITEIDPIRSVARVRTISAKSVEMPIRNTIPVATYEGEAETGDDSTSTYQNTNVVPFRQTHTIPITVDMLQDGAFDMESEVADDSAEAFAFGEGNGFVVGTGFKQPQGFVSDADLQAGARLSGVSGELTPDSLILITGDLKQGYNPVYVMNRRTLALIRTFRADAVSAGDASGGFLWQPGLNGAAPSTINGHPYILANSMPDVAAGAFAVAFGDFRRGYTIVDRTGLSVVRDEFTLKKRGIVEFTMNRWNTGQVTLREPIKLLRITT